MPHSERPRRLTRCGTGTWSRCHLFNTDFGNFSSNNNNILQGSLFLFVKNDSQQAEVDRVMAASLSTAVFDEVLRDISFWIQDLDGVCGDVAASVAEVTALHTELEVATTEDDVARAIWLSEQYGQVESRLMELRQRLEPIEEAVEAFRSLQVYVRECQPAKAETEEQRDAILAAMFDALGQRGLEALHPFGAWGNTDGEVQGYGGDLRSLVQGLIEEARRIPKYPVFGEDQEQTSRLSTEEELGTLFAKNKKIGIFLFYS